MKAWTRQTLSDSVIIAERTLSIKIATQRESLERKYIKKRSYSHCDYEPRVFVHATRKTMVVFASHRGGNLGYKINVTSFEWKNTHRVHVVVRSQRTHSHCSYYDLQNINNWSWYFFPIITDLHKWENYERFLRDFWEIRDDNGLSPLRVIRVFKPVSTGSKSAL